MVFVKSGALPAFSLSIFSEGMEISNFVVKVSYEAKLRELLRNITSAEPKLCIDASREFIKLLKGDEGGNLLREYIKTSPLCTELVQAWNHRLGKPGLSYIWSVISAIFSHPDGMYKANDMGVVGISRALDKFAKLIIEERLNDVCKELNSKEVKCQNASLLLLASIVRRGSGLASDVAKTFDFKIPGFSKLSEYKSRRKFEIKRKHSTRRSFVEFAMSFLEVGKPGLLRWVIQQKEMFSGVLRGLGSDENGTVVYVLSTLRDKILTPESLVPPGLRSVLFGSVTLDQLIQISGREDGGLATEIAAEVLYMVCTDPSNGLMPDVNRQPNPLKGNLTRLLGVMKKLKAMEIKCHRDLLLAIVHGRPQFAAAYLDEFPYSLEDHASTNWFAAISLAADLISSVAAGSPFGFTGSQALEPPSIDSPDLRSLLKCIGPRPFTRAVINKGLLHSESLVKHGTLRLVLEALKLLDSFFCAINSSSDLSSQILHNWASLQPEIQNEVRILLPDPQVLVKLLSSLNKYVEPCLKRAADAEVVVERNRNGTKKLKICSLTEETDMQECVDPHLKRAIGTNIVLKHKKDGAKKLRNRSPNVDLDILVGGINASTDDALPNDSGRVLEEDIFDVLDYSNRNAKDITELWGLHQGTNSITTPEDEETLFSSKLLDTLCIYHRAMPTVVQGSFDFFKLLPSNPLALPTILQQSLLSLLIEQIGYSSNRVDAIRILPQIYKNLNSFINLLIYSPNKDIKDQAYVLAQAAMLSTGAFDCHLREIDAWFLFLPGYGRKSVSIEEKGENIRNHFSVVVSFLCDAVSTLGNNIFKYWDLLKCQIYDLKGVKGASPGFSPLFICVLEKCARLLGSESGNFSIHEKSIVSMYVSNTLIYLLQTQVDAGLLASLVNVLLHNKLKDHFSVADASEDFCEWRPLKSSFCFSKSILDQQICNIVTIEKTAMHADSSFVDTLDEVEKVLKARQDCELAGVTAAFLFSVPCTNPASILQHFPSVISILQQLPGAPVSILLPTVFLEKSLLNCVLKLWPQISFSALDRVIAVIHNEEIKEELVVDLDADITGHASVAFYAFLMQAPFYVLFPAFISIDCPFLLHTSKLQALLSFKLSEGIADHFISSLQLVLFWFRQIQLSYRTKPVYELEQLSEICFNLLDGMFEQLSAGKTNPVCLTVFSTPTSTQHAQDMAEIIFCHPAVTDSLKCPLSGSKEFTEDIFGKTSEEFIGLAREGVHKMDYHVLNILTTYLNHLFPFCDDSKSRYEVDSANDRIQKPLKSLTQMLLLIVRERFDNCISNKNFVALIPSLYAVHTLIRFICPFELLELVYWMFTRGSLNDPAFPVSSKISSLSVGLSIAGRAFDLLSCFEDPHLMKLSFNFNSSEEKSSSVTLLEGIYFYVVDIATSFELPIADHCLLKAVKLANAHKFLQHRGLPLCTVMSKLVSNTPTKILSHCMHMVTMTKAQLLFHVSEVSPLHLSVFGHLFTDMVNHSLISKGNMMEGLNHGFSDDDFMMLLPTALSYVSSTLMTYGKQFYQHLRYIPSLYWSIVLGGFSNWKSYVSRDIFHVELGENLPSSVEELLNVVHNSVLGKAIFMMRCYLAFSGASVEMNKRLKLYKQVCPSGTNDLLDCGISDIDACSLDHALNHVTLAVTKIYLCRMMLFAENSHILVLPKEGEDGVEDPKDIPSKSKKEILARIKFVNTLVHTWQLIVKKFPSVSDVRLKVKATNYSLFRLLETFILRNIVELLRETHIDTTTDSNSFPCIEELARSCLLHRFEDPATIRMLQSVLTFVPEGSSFHILVLQHLVSHSQFAPVIQSASETSTVLQFGMIFRPISSILRSLVFSSTDQNTLVKINSHQSSVQLKLLEIVQLLRILFHRGGHLLSIDSGEDIGINSEELLFLLLSCYGASVSKIDLEIYNLMQEIECTVKSNHAIIKEMDYLWGTAAKRVRKESEIDEGLTSNDKDDAEAVKERRRTRFRENLPIDPKMCISTVLYFPYDRVLTPGALLSNKLQRNTAIDMPEVCDATAKELRVYDPFFILRFSIHSLSMGYIEPLEFVSLGLLAVAIVSLSSLDAEMRKLGYETLGRFKSVLEISQKRKDAKQLRLLLEYLQNGINEPWQRIPSIAAVFVAEASFLLLDRSNPYYSTIIGVLKGKPMNMESIPLFHHFFWSTSNNYKSERLWMLRLLCAGLNLEDDAKIYKSNSILEILLSFYVSPLSDYESRELIIQILKKSVMLYETSCYLVMDCNVVSWLSSTISKFYGGVYQDQRSFSSTHLADILEVISGIISSRHTVGWLQNNALGQLTELSSHLYRLLVCSLMVVNGKDHLVNSILEILTLISKIALKRDVSQSQFTLSVEVLFQLYQVIDVYKFGDCSPNPELGLKLVLMSTPQAAIFSMDQEKLHKFIVWAVSTAIQSLSMEAVELKEYNNNFGMFFENEQSEDSLVSKLLWWLATSAIIGRLSRKPSLLESNSSSPKTLQALLEETEGLPPRTQAGFCSEELLAATIFYLQQLLGTKCSVLPSVVTALCLLLFSDSSLAGSDICCGQESLSSVCSRIHCPSWRRSFNQPWKDDFSEYSVAEKMDEIHACQSLLLVISNMLSKNSLNSQYLSYQDVENLGVFKWERSLLES